MQPEDGYGAYCTPAPPGIVCAAQDGHPGPLNGNLIVLVDDVPGTPLKVTPHTVEAGSPPSRKVAVNFVAMKFPVMVPPVLLGEMLIVVDPSFVLLTAMDEVLDFHELKSSPALGKAVRM